MDIGDGWMVDEADPDVGIFGDFVFHNECPDVMENDGEPFTPDHQTFMQDDTKLRLVNIQEVYTCPCGAVKVLTSQEPAEWFEEPRHD
jgi:hypothetical protein